MFKWIGKFLKKLLKAIKKILAIVLIVIAICLILWATLLSGGAALVLFGFAISQTAALVIGAVALVGAFLVDGKTAKQVVGKIGDAAGSAAGAVAGAVGSVVGGATGGLVGALLDNPVLMWGGIAVAAYFLLSPGDEEKKGSAASRSTGDDLKRDVSATAGKQRKPSVPVSDKPGDLSALLSA